MSRMASNEDWMLCKRRGGSSSISNSYTRYFTYVRFTAVVLRTYVKAISDYVTVITVGQKLRTVYVAS